MLSLLHGRIQLHEFKIPSKGKEVVEVRIDPSQRLLDIDITNNTWKK